MNKPSLGQLKNIKLFSAEVSFRLTRDDITVWGLVLCALLFVFVLFWDAYIFTSVIFAERTTHEVEFQKPRGFSGKDVDEVIKTLDERAGKLNLLLGVTKTQK